MIGTDTHNDVHPAPYPSMGNSFHVVCLVAMGLWLIDNANLEELGPDRGAAQPLGVPDDGGPPPSQERDGLPGQSNRGLLDGISLAGGKSA